MPVGSFKLEGDIAAPSPLSAPSRRYGLPFVRLLRHVQWFASSQNDGATLPKHRAHKVRGGVWSYQDSASPHPHSLAFAIAMHVPMVRPIQRPSVRKRGITDMHGYLPRRHTGVPLVICHLQPPLSGLHTTPKVGTFGS